MATEQLQQQHQQSQQQDGQEREESDEQQRQSTAQEVQSEKQQQKKQQKWTRPQSGYQQQGPTGQWVDQYTRRRAISRAFNRVTQEELEDIVTRLRQPTVSSTGAEGLKDKQFVYTTPKYTKSNPRVAHKKAEPRTPEERDAIAQRLFSAKTRAWIARREKNPNTRVHYSTDFTII